VAELLVGLARYGHFYNHERPPSESRLSPAGECALHLRGYAVRRWTVLQRLIIRWDALNTSCFLVLTMGRSIHDLDVTWRSGRSVRSWPRFVESPRRG
jgi:hypothetical protein